MQNATHLQQDWRWGWEVVIQGHNEGRQDREACPSHLDMIWLPLWIRKCLDYYLHPD